MCWNSVQAILCWNWLNNCCQNFWTNCTKFFGLVCKNVMLSISEHIYMLTLYSFIPILYCFERHSTRHMQSMVYWSRFDGGYWQNDQLPALTSGVDHRWKKSKRFQALPTLHVTKTSYTFCPMSLNSFNDLDVLYVSNIPNTTTVVNYWVNMQGKKSNHKVRRTAHSRMTEV